MPQLINEAKRMQFLAGLITESQLNEEMDIKTLDVASYLAAMDSTDPKNQSLIQSVKQVIDADLSKRSIVINKLKDYAKSNKSNNGIQDKVTKAIEDINAQNESLLNEESSMQFYRKSFPWETFKNKAKELFPDAEVKIEHWEDQSNPGVAWGTTILSKQLTKDQLEQIANTFSELKNEEEVKKPSTAKPTTLDKIKSFFKKKPQQESIESTVNEALRKFRKGK